MIPSSVTGLPRLGTAHGSLLHSGPRPRLVWAGDVDGAPERLELSGRVSATWANKVANLLVEEIDAGPGSRVLLDLPRHWRTLAWSLGTWLTGASVLLADSADPTDSEMPDVVVTRSLETAELAVTRGAEVVVLVPLASFALRVPGGTPAGVLDGSADVAAQPDDLGPVQPALASATALETAALEIATLGAARQSWTYTDLFGEAPLPTDAWWAARAVAEWAAGADVHLTGSSPVSTGR
ncbi:TIGR03089 family protein [Salana multivorans]